MGCGLSPDWLLFVPDTPRDDDRSAILERLAAYNREYADPGSTGPLAILIRDAEGVTIGGLWATTLFRWLRIELLFVPPAMRGSSLGTAIMAKAEALAGQRGCIGASLDTYSFQARGFYEKLGYSLVGTIPDCPPGSERHFLQKRLPGGSSAQDAMRS